KKPQTCGLPCQRRQARMPRKVTPNLARIRIEIKERAYALHDVFEAGIVRDLDRKTEQVPVEEGTHTEPSGRPTDANLAAILALMHRFHTGSRFVGKEPCQKRPIEWWPIRQLESHRAAAETLLMAMAPKM